MSNVNFIKNAEDVSVVRYGKTKGDVILRVNDEEVRLNRRHPISVTASLTTPEDATESIKGGHFVFNTHVDKNGKEVRRLHEFRDQSYNGFMQTDDFLQRFGSDDTLESRGADRFEIQEFGLGGDFALTAGFTWSAFNRNLKTQVSVIRQICDNGMVARNKMFEREVPIINLYDHHLDIAARQLIDISRRELTKRIEVMGREHSTNKEFNLVYNHVEKRLRQNPYDARLTKISELMEENGSISEFYTKNAIDNGIVQALPSPVSRFDLWNIVTELNSHTEELVESTRGSLDKIATSLIFPKNTGTAIATASAKSTFGSPEQAFFG